MTSRFAVGAISASFMQIFTHLRSFLARTNAFFTVFVNSSMRLYELENQTYVPNPFPRSVEGRVLFHGTNVQFDKFERRTHGIYVTPLHSWASQHYGGIVVPLYANITKMYEPTEEEIDLFYDRDYQAVEALLARLSAKGYNGCMFGGESESTVLFNHVDMIHATTGKPL